MDVPPLRRPGPASIIIQNLGHSVINQAIDHQSRKRRQTSKQRLFRLLIAYFFHYLLLSPPTSIVLPSCALVYNSILQVPPGNYNSQNRQRILSFFVKIYKKIPQATPGGLEGGDFVIPQGWQGHDDTASSGMNCIGINGNKSIEFPAGLDYLGQ